ncbi:MAG: CapA family protein [Candidatus Pacebacteria bacterium]|nr:CapA family protein [Candidatus Paceibacterota bacterium]
MKNLLILLSLSIILIGGVFLFLPEKQTTQTTNPEARPKTSGARSTPAPLLVEEYSLLFVGDVMLDRGVEVKIEEHGEDYTFPFLLTVDILQEADILFGNLESMISDKGRNVGSIYSFRADPMAVEGLLFAGFDVLSLANNHTFDYGREAFEDTMDRLKAEGIKYTGAGFNREEAHTSAVITLDDGTRVGFLGYTDFLYPFAFSTEERSGVSNFSLESLKEDIEKAEEETDLLVVSLHSGEEYQKQQNEHQELVSKKAVDYGADLIIGHHPHVTQPVEKYKDGYIAYSLGNFVFDQYFSEETMEGFMVEVKIKEGKITEVNKINYKLNKNYQPQATNTVSF